MTSELQRFLSEFKGNPPAEKALIQKFEAETQIKLPDEYAEFLLRMNGGEGFVGGAYLILWRIEELRELNEAYQAGEYAPGLFLFGSDGGGEAFAFDLRDAERRIVSVPFVGMDVTLAREVAPSFDKFFQALTEQED